jgi:hypothetical protein
MKRLRGMKKNTVKGVDAFPMGEMTEEELESKDEDQ